MTKRDTKRLIEDLDGFTTGLEAETRLFLERSPEPLE
ncbi:hypothetical protein N826_25715 [Skermanella aerolata KACC 11604]|nr:hypothetical protein N826_25715 [Skermanella aerolata KACC 11604]